MEKLAWVVSNNWTKQNMHYIKLGPSTGSLLEYASLESPMKIIVDYLVFIFRIQDISDQLHVLLRLKN